LTCFEQAIVHHQEQFCTNSLHVTASIVSYQRLDSSLRCMVKYCKLLVQTPWWWTIICSKHVEDINQSFITNWCTRELLKGVL